MHYQSREEMLRKIQEDTHRAVAKVLQVRHYEDERKEKAWRKVMADVDKNGDFSGADGSNDR